MDDYLTISTCSKASRHGRKRISQENVVAPEKSLSVFRVAEHATTTRGKLIITIDGNDYDMTDFDHPGGTIIMSFAGKDASTVFFATHPVKVWKMLQTTEFKSKFLVNESNAHRKLKRNKAGNYVFNDDFYLECKSLVDRHLKDWKVRWGKHFDCAVLAAWTFVWIFALFCAYANMLAQRGSVISCVLLGIISAMCVFNIMHSSMHGALCNVEPVKSIMDHTYTAFSGGSCARWMTRHNVEHHGYMNTSRDPDKHTQPFLRLHPAQPQRWHFEYQHIYFPVLACINTWPSQFRHLFEFWSKEPLNQWDFRPAKILQYHVALSFWFIVAWIIPVYAFGFRAGMKVSLIFQSVASAFATYNVVINHIFEQSHTSTESFGKSFAKRSVAGSCNWSAGSMLATFFSGGLNHQIEHHLFPSLPVHHYPLIASKIECVCKKHQVPYNNKSLFSCIVSMHATLNLYGTCEPMSHLPGLGDYQALMEG